MAHLARLQPIARLARCGAAIALVASAAAARPAGAEAPVVQVVPLHLVEWRLSPQALTIAPGTTVRFVVANEGVLAHALAVEGEGVYAETGAIGSGETATLDLTFTMPGVYDLYCPLSYGQHRALGQEAVLVVGAAAPPCAGSSPCLASSGEAPATMQGAAPPAESGAAAAEDTAPPAESGAAAAEDTAPPAESGAAAAEDTAPPAESVAAAAEDTAPPAESGAAAAEDTAPPAESGAAAAEDTAPPAGPVSGAAEDAAGEAVEATLPETPDGPAPG